MNLKIVVGMCVALCASVVRATPSWTSVALETANPPTPMSAFKNAIAGVLPTEYINGMTSKPVSDAKNLTNGAIPVHTSSGTVSINNNSSLTYSVGEADVGIGIKCIRVYSSWDDSGRVQIKISSVSVQTVSGGDTWTELANSSVSTASSSGNGYCATYKDDADAAVATGVTAVKIVFPNQQNNSVGYGEIEIETAGNFKIPVNITGVEGFGTVVSEPASADWTFNAGTVVKITATSSDGSVFDRWCGNIDRAKRFDNPITVTVDDTVNLTPVFKRPWVWSNNVMTDGYWKVTTEASGDNLKIKKVEQQAATTCPVLDLNKTITGTDKVLVSINDSVLNSKSSINTINFADTMTKIGDSCRQLPDLEAVHLPVGLVTLSHCAFYGCPKLKYVEPLLPDTLAGWGGDSGSSKQMFAGCPLVGAFRLSNPNVTFIPDSICFSGGNVMTNVDLTGSGVTKICENAFRTCSKIVDVWLPAALTYIGNCPFYSCSSIKSIYFSRALDSIHSGGLQGLPSTARFVVRPSDKEAFISMANSWTAWEKVSSGDKTTYANNYDDECIPLGKIKLGSSGTTVYLVEMPVTTIQLSVRTDPEDADLLASISPACADNTEISKSYVSRVPAAVAGADRYAQATGYTLYRYENDTWTLVKTMTGGVTEATFTDATSGSYKLVWNFDTLGYAVHVTPVSDALGTTVLSDPNVQSAYYAPGTVVTATTTPNEGTFSSYLLDGATLATTPVASFTVNGVCRLTPVYQWHYFSSNTLGNGDWLFNVSADAATNVTISSVKTQGIIPTLDFTMGSDNATIVSIGGAFFGNKFIKEALLPDTLTSLGEYAFRESTLTKIRLSNNLQTLGHCAFWGCGSLTTVEPLMPATLTSLSIGENFSGCPIVADKLVLSNKALTAIPGSFMFAPMTIGEIDLSGSSVASIGENAFRTCKSKKITFPKTLKSLAHCAFHDAAGSLEQLIFKGPAVTFGTSECFQGWSALQTRIYIPQGDASWEAYFAANPTRIADMTDAEIETFKTKYPNEKAAKRKVQLPNFGTWEYLCHLPTNGFMLLLR